jgi:hypothetical protein
MPVTYYDLGPNKRLCDIVIAGSHDAGITGGAGHVKTQKRNIGEQAFAGVRVFDLRMTSKGILHPELKTYHGFIAREPDTKSFFGASGEVLDDVLRQAHHYVTTGAPTEFLILKFDKCSGWSKIAQQCVTILGNRLFTGNVNLNTQTLDQLKRHVIVLFTKSGMKEVHKTHGPQNGIYPIRKVPEDEPYDANFFGLQYCGKGGTGTDNADNFAYKVQQNITTQTARFNQGLGNGGDPDVLGMVYWTTTGKFGNIRDRDRFMWKHQRRSQLKQMFQDFVAGSIQDRIARLVDPTNHAFGTVLKVYMPNIVMIDFANDTKCRRIKALNTLASTEITNKFKELDDENLRRQARNLDMNVLNRFG